MVAYADTSFLLSIYLEDEHTLAAHRFLGKNPFPLCLTAFSMGETKHALRLLAFRRVISSTELTRCLLLFERDQADGFYQNLFVDGAELFRKTEELSERFAYSRGIRFPDLLHIASALLGEPSHFLSFDITQRHVARTVGLRVVF